MHASPSVANVFLAALQPHEPPPGFAPLAERLEASIGGEAAGFAELFALLAADAPRGDFLPPSGNALPPARPVALPPVATAAPPTSPLGDAVPAQLVGQTAGPSLPMREASAPSIGASIAASTERPRTACEPASSVLAAVEGAADAAGGESLPAHTGSSAPRAEASTGASPRTPILSPEPSASPATAVAAEPPRGFDERAVAGASDRRHATIPKGDEPPVLTVASGFRATRASFSEAASPEPAATVELAPAPRMGQADALPDAGVRSGLSIAVPEGRSGAMPTGSPTGASHSAEAFVARPEPEALANGIRYLIDHRIGEARLTLNPPELGSVNVKISVVDEQTYVQIVASNPGTRDDLEHSLPRLRELLAFGGLELAGASVSGGRGERGAEPSPWLGSVAAEADDAPAPLAGAPPRPSERRGRIDLYA